METEVAAFNRRLSSLNAPRFSESHISSWLPPVPGRRIFAEFVLALDDDNVVRGAYGLKHQDYQIAGSVISIGNATNLTSEGIADPKYTLLGVQLLRHAMRKQPLSYGLGMGGENNDIVRLFRAAKWRITKLPFFFRVIRPYNFLRNISYLRTSAPRKLILDALAFSGLGWLGATSANFILQRRVRRFPDLVAEPVNEFSDWSDEVWRRAAAEYPYCAVRDQVTLRILYPEHDPRFHRLKIHEGGRLIGWAVVLATDLKNHKQFGDMRLGSIIDAFASPSDAAKIVQAADQFLRSKNVDLIVSNQSFRPWCDAMRNCGYLQGPTNFLLATSPKLTEMLEREQIAEDMIYLNRGDGDGPIHL